ncbi:MAG: ABC transporter permease [Defluviitaleaceae bacterium]|nr:ABC transporter permease [Defluviitaleaceae bacterium]
MYKVVIRRFLMLIPQMLALSLAIFIMAQFMPGDALSGIFDPSITHDDIELMREELGLNRNPAMRYIEWLGGLLRGDFGRSLMYHRPVLELIGDRAGNTFRLSLLTTVFMYVMAIPMGLVSGRYHETFADKSIIFFTFFALAMPTIIFALINLWLFGFRLDLFPLYGSVDAALPTGSFAYHMSRLHHLILPALTGAILGTVGTINILRDRIIETENADFVTTARSKGVPPNVVYSRHIFKNAALPVVAGFGPALAGLLGGSVFIEKIFGFPGMGNLFVTSILSNDYPVANGLIMIYGVLIVLGVLLGDIFMMILDPRIRIE